MIRLFAVEWYKIRHRRLNWITLGVLCAVMVTIYLLLWATTSAIEDASGPIDNGRLGELRSSLFLEEAVPFGITMLFGFGLLAGIVVISGNVGSDYTWNTVRTFTAAHPKRSDWMLAKMAALGLAIVVGLLIALAVAVVTSAAITLVDGNFSLSFIDGAYARDSVLSFIRLLVGCSPYFAMSLLAASWGGSSTAGIAVGVGVAFLEGIISGLMSLAGGWVAQVPQFLFDRNADTLALESGSGLQALVESSPFGDVIEMPDPVQAAAVLLTWATLLSALAVVQFQRQELYYRS